MDISRTMILNSFPRHRLVQRKKKDLKFLKLKLVLWIQPRLINFAYYWILLKTVVRNETVVSLSTHNLTTQIIYFIFMIVVTWSLIMCMFCRGCFLCRKVYQYSCNLRKSSKLNKIYKIHYINLGRKISLKPIYKINKKEWFLRLIVRWNKT